MISLILQCVWMYPVAKQVAKNPKWMMPDTGRWFLVPALNVMQKKKIKTRQIECEWLNLHSWDGHYQPVDSPTLIRLHNWWSSSRIFESFTLFSYTLFVSQVNDEEALEEDEFMNELKEIHTRKMTIQQKLDQFHHRHSVSHGKNG